MDPAGLARAWQRRDAEDAASAAATSAALRDRARDAAVCLVERFGARRVVLFGSVVHDAAGEGSDVDLAVAGLAPAQQLAAMAEVELIVGRSVDLVRLEEAAPLLRQSDANGLPIPEPARIAEEGEVLAGEEEHRDV